MKFSQCDHKYEEWTGKSTEIDIRLYIEPKRTPVIGDYGRPQGMYVDTGQAYAICEVDCKKCGKAIQRKGIVVKPSDLEILIPVPMTLSPTPMETEP